MPHTKYKHFVLPAFLLLATTLFARQTSPAQSTLKRPKLIVGIVVDQMRWDYLYRFYNRYGQAGFRRMQNLPENERELLIKANPVLLHIALNNIISNAFKFSDNKPVYCLLDMQDTAIELSFTDQGPGIAEDAFTEIFKPFYSATTESRHR